MDVDVGVATLKDAHGAVEVAGVEVLGGQGLNRGAGRPGNCAASRLSSQRRTAAAMVMVRPLNFAARNAKRLTGLTRTNAAVPDSSALRSGSW